MSGTSLCGDHFGICVSLHTSVATMGKLSKALGVGSKGSLRIELDRRSYSPGDVVNGTVYLSVSGEIKTKEGEGRVIFVVRAQRNGSHACVM
jgi:hypothetical protein